MSDLQQRRDQDSTGAGTPPERLRPGRSGEGAASALEQLISQNEQRRKAEPDRGAGFPEEPGRT